MTITKAEQLDPMTELCKRLSDALAIAVSDREELLTAARLARTEIADELESEYSHPPESSKSWLALNSIITKIEQGAA